ncbi:MAG: hypothetical protein OEY49_06040 [Candidatus Heimdallarchaeota archaeon]|nr:hypothetical protein [Candidatus Heimdallarchaeota archaeon]
MERKINERLRNHSRRKKNRQRGDTNSDYLRSEEQEILTDFTQQELEEMLIEDGIASKVKGIIGIGKEASVYWIEDNKGNDLALKMFRIHRTSHNFNSLHARSKLSDTGKLSIASGLCRREFLNLTYMYEGGVRVPTPVAHHEFIYTMKFLGDKYGSAPLLGSVNLKRFYIDPIEVLDEILDNLEIMFTKAMIVHGDFSEHNIVWFEEKPWIIDVYQSQRYHPEYQTTHRIAKIDALKVLKKDIYEILNHFEKKYRVSYDPDEVFDAIAKTENQDWIPTDLLSENIDLDAYIEEQKKVRFD